MKSSFLFAFCFSLYLNIVNCQSIKTDAKIDSKDLKCLVCKQSLHELKKAVGKLDPTRKVDVGGHRLDLEGNYGHKSVPQDKSELVLSELMEGICDKMDDYVRALWKSNGTLTLLSMLDESGKMNPNWSEVDIIQDDDLNKSLKYYCEEIVEEFEDNIIKLLQEEATDLQKEFCYRESKLCYKKKRQEEL